ncbi:MAG TPA: tetratricopeptide repeat protein, partial [Nannocystaceae bacterium]|nr:tetratricopeptide repeat protein [Nannocystaceae bacterium]
HGDAVDGARIRVELDEYANRWGEAYRERCAAVPELGKVPWQQLDAQVRCLRHKWLVFDALVHQLETSDDASAPAIASAIAELPAPSACADARERPASLEPPPEQIVVVEDLRARLDAIESISIAGRYREALAELAKLEAEAAPLDFAPLRIELLATRGYLHDYLAEYDESAAILERVVYDAESLGYDHLHARALRTLLYVLATHQDRVAEAKALLPQADALVRRLDNPAIEAELTEAHAIVALYDDDLAAAEQQFRAALVLADGHYGPESRLAAQVAQNLGNVLLRRSRPSEAEPFIRRALEFHRRQGAPGNIASGLSLLGITQFQLGRYREATTTQREALEIRERLLGPDHPRTISTVHNLTVLAVTQGDFAGAEAYGRREIAAIESNKSHPESARAVAYLTQGQVAMVRGDWQRSEALLELALVHAGERGPGSAARLDLATLARSCGRFAAARASIERERIADTELGESVATPRTYDVDLALVELAQGDANAAETRLRSVLDEIGDDPRTEVRQVVQRASVIAANAARRAKHCDEALRFAARATALQLGDEGELAWWRALARAESAAAKRCLGEREGADDSLPEDRSAAQIWWDLRVPDVAHAWATEHALDPWIAAHPLVCP